MLSLKYNLQAELGSEITRPNGRKMIVLKPESWIKKELPLTSHIVTTESEIPWNKGFWTIVLVHVDCPKCKLLVSKMEKENV